jgi:hypothetical protein
MLIPSQESATQFLLGSAHGARLQELLAANFALQFQLFLNGNGPEVEPALKSKVKGGPPTLKLPHQ